MNLTSRLAPRAHDERIPAEVIDDVDPVPVPTTEPEPTEPPAFEAVNSALGHWVDDDRAPARWNTSVERRTPSATASVNDGSTRYAATGTYRDGTAGLSLSQRETTGAST